MPGSGVTITPFAQTQAALNANSKYSRGRCIGSPGLSASAAPRLEPHIPWRWPSAVTVSDSAGSFKFQEGSAAMTQFSTMEPPCIGTGTLTHLEKARAPGLT